MISCAGLGVRWLDRARFSFGSVTCRFAGGGPRSSSCTSSPLGGCTREGFAWGFLAEPRGLPTFDARTLRREPRVGHRRALVACDRGYLRTASPGGVDALWSQRRRQLLFVFAPEGLLALRWMPRCRAGVRCAGLLRCAGFGRCAGLVIDQLRGAWGSVARPRALFLWIGDVSFCRRRT